MVAFKGNIGFNFVTTYISLYLSQKVYFCSRLTKYYYYVRHCKKSKENNC